MIYSKEQARLNLIAAVRLIGKYFALKYDPDQPRDEAGRWTDGGGSSEGAGGESGGGGVSSVDVRGYSEGRLIRGERNITQDEKQKIVERFENKPDEIHAIFTGDKPVYIVVEEGRAESWSNTIRVSEKYIDTHVMDHEMLHYGVNTNNTIRMSVIDEYNPPFVFEHAQRYGDDIESVKEEHLVMLLTAYDRDESVWADNISYIERSSYQMTTDEAAAQRDALKDYLERIKIW